jgi:hypothetical protein
LKNWVGVTANRPSTTDAVLCGPFCVLHTTGILVPIFLLGRERSRNRNGHSFDIDGSLSVLSPEFRHDSAFALATLQELGVRHNDVR